MPGSEGSVIPVGAIPYRRSRARLSRGARARVWLGALAPIEWLALVALAVTPVALFADYRLGLLLIDDLVTYTPIGEAGGRPVSYRQVVGSTQALWLGAGLMALVWPGRRAGYRSITAIALMLLVGVALIASALSGGIDRTTIISLTSTAVPLVAMIVVLGDSRLRVSMRRLFVLMLTGAGAAVVLLTGAKNVIAGTLFSQRFDTFAWGTSTDSGLVLAALVLLVPAAAGPVILRFGLAGILAAGLLLTETRGALLAAATGALFLGLLARRMLLAIAGIVAAFGLFSLVSERSLTFGDIATTYRIQNLDYHWQLFLDRPLLGHGISSATLDSFRAAHNTLLGIANATGVVGLFLWLIAWIVPLVIIARVHGRTPTVAVAVGTAVATFVGWITTGPEVMIYSPPTNLLGLVLAIVIAGASAIEVPLPRSRLSSSRVVPPTNDSADWLPTRLGRSERPAPEPSQDASAEPASAGDPRARVRAAGVSERSRARRPILGNQLLWPSIVLGAVALVGLILFRPHGASIDDERRAASVYAEQVASTCRPICRVLGQTRVGPGIWRFRIQEGSRPPICIDITLDRFEPVPATAKFRGLAYVRCNSDLELTG